MRHCIVRVVFAAVSLWLLASFGGVAFGAEGYVLVVGNGGIGQVDLYDMTGTGSLSLRSGFDIWNDTLRFGSPWDLVPSGKGNYVFFYDWNQDNGALYSVDTAYQFHFVKEFMDGAGGGGFTTDEQYLFTLTGFYGFPRGYYLQAYRVSGAQCDLVTSQSVPADRVVGWNYLVTSRDEVMGSGTFDFSPAAFTIYQFSRTSETLSLKQYIPSVQCLYSALGVSEDFVGYTFNRTVGTIARRSDGVWELRDSYWDPAWGVKHGWGVYVTPDSGYLVSIISSTDTPRGVLLFSLTPDRRLHFLHMLDRDPTALAMTPDGRFFTVAYDVGDTIGVFQIDRARQRLEEVASIAAQTPGVFCMKFLPQAFPPAKAGPVWNSYSMKDPPAAPPLASAPSLCDPKTNRSGAPPPSASAPQTTRSVALRARRAPDGRASPRRPLAISR